jgi:MarR family transcriptional regulator, organic hydroperoxide resistance regulator
MNQNPDLQPLWNDPAERIISLFRSISKIYKDQMFEKSRQYGFTGPQMLLIFTLHKNPFTTLNELSELIGLTKSTVSGIVDRLVSHGVVVREIPEDNRRTVRLSLSSEFEKNNDLMCLKKNFIVDILNYASEDDLEKIICGLERMYSLIKKTKA